MDERDGYERWIGPVFRGDVPPRRAFLPPRLRWIAVVSLLTWIVLVASGPFGPGLRVPAGVALLLTALAGGFVWIPSWSVAIERTHVRLLARPDLGDGRRIALFFGALIGFGVASLAILWVSLWLLGGRTAG